MGPTSPGNPSSTCDPFRPPQAAGRLAGARTARNFSFCRRILRCRLPMDSTPRTHTGSRIRAGSALRGRFGTSSTDKPASPDKSRPASQEQVGTGPSASPKELARTTEPGSAEYSRVPGGLEGPAGPVRAPKEFARTTEPGSAEYLRVPKGNPPPSPTPSALAAAPVTADAKATYDEAMRLLGDKATEAVRHF
jgi:hypothetical protein